MTLLTLQISKIWALLLNSCSTFALIFGISTLSWGQIDTGKEKSSPSPVIAPSDNFSPTKWSIKADVVSLFVPIKSHGYLGAEWRFIDKWGLDGGFGYFFGSTSFANGKGETYRGPTFRLAVKCYELTNKRHTKVYIGPEFRYQDITNKRKYVASRQGGQYEEVMLIKRKVKRKSFGLMFGKVNHFGKSKSIYLDVSMFLGVSSNNVTFDLPQDATISTESLEQRDEGEDLLLPSGKSFKSHYGFSLMVGYWIR